MTRWYVSATVISAGYAARAQASLASELDTALSSACLQYPLCLRRCIWPLYVPASIDVPDGQTRTLGHAGRSILAIDANVLVLSRLKAMRNDMYIKWHA